LNLLAVPWVPSVPPEKTKTNAKNSNPAFVPGTFGTATAPMAGPRASAGFDRIGGKRHPLLSGNNAYSKIYAGL
jgi:hypothetical protein